MILPEIVKEPSPSKLVNGTKNGCQKWPVEQKMALNFG